MLKMILGITNFVHATDQTKTLCRWRMEDGMMIGAGMQIIVTEMTNWIKKENRRGNFKLIIRTE